MKPTLGIVIVVAGLAVGSVASRAEDAPKLVLSKEEQKLLELTNAEREKEGLKPLRPSLTLFKVARAHSANMAEQMKLSHELDGKKPRDRVKGAGYRYYFTGENIAQGQVGLKYVVKGWMDSEGHRKNILSPNYTEIGLGRAVDTNGEAYYTQVFGKPR
jgi:uncharacterized protein YkwD